MSVSNVSRFLLAAADSQNGVVDFTKQVKFLDVPDNIATPALLKSSVRTSYEQAVGTCASGFPKTFKQTHPVIIGKNAVAIFMFLNGGYRNSTPTLETQVYQDALRLHSAIMTNKDGFSCKSEFHKLHEFPDKTSEEDELHACPYCLETLTEFISINTFIASILMRDCEIDLRMYGSHSNSYLKLRLMMWLSGIPYKDIIEYPWGLLTLLVQRDVVPHMLTKNILAKRIYDQDITFSELEEVGEEHHHIKLLSPNAPEHKFVESEDGKKSCKACEDLIFLLKEAATYYDGIQENRVLKPIFGLPLSPLHRFGGRCHEGESNKLTYNGLLGFTKRRMSADLFALKSHNFTGRLSEAHPEVPYIYTDYYGQVRPRPHSEEEKIIWNLFQRHMKYNVPTERMEGLMKDLVIIQNVLRRETRDNLSEKEQELYNKYRSGELQDELTMVHINQVNLVADEDGPKERKFTMPKPYITYMKDGVMVKKYLKHVLPPHEIENDEDDSMTAEERYLNREHFAQEPL